MLIEMLKSKIYGLRVTEAELSYEGSLSLDPAIREAAGLHVNEKILVVNNNNGERLETYILPGTPGQVCLNGAAARKGVVGDELIVMAFCQMEPGEAVGFEPIKIRVDDKNDIVSAEK